MPNHPGRIDHDHATFGVDADVTEGRFVQLNNTGNVEHADAADDAIGTAERTVTLASGDPVAVRLISAPSHVVEAGGTITVGLEVIRSTAGVVIGGAGKYVALNAAASGEILVIVKAN